MAFHRGTLFAKAHYADLRVRSTEQGHQLANRVGAALAERQVVFSEPRSSA